MKIELIKSHSISEWWHIYVDDMELGGGTEARLTPIFRALQLGAKHMKGEYWDGESPEYQAVLKEARNAT